MYRPRIENPVPIKLIAPVWSTVQGVRTKTYPVPETDTVFYGSFKTYGGTERSDNGVYSIEDTAVVECVYRTDITSDCRIINALSGAIYEIIGEPENLEMRNRFLRFKVRRVKGKT